MSVFKNKILLITGGTGSFGNAVLKRFLNTDIKEIRVFSRDELKQDNMRHIYDNKKIRYYIGDVRNYSSIQEATVGVDYIFHAAALKEVPSCEFFPMEAVRTNCIGTDNVLTAAIANNVNKVICLSTDKAAYAINAMGISKAMMEKIAVSKSRTVDPEKTSIVCTRYGNVMYSRGSVIPLFIEQIKNGSNLTLTEPSMTRFIMSLDEAVNLVLFAFEHGESGDIFVQKASATTIEVLASAVKKLYGYEKENTIIGIRHGEKMYETLLTNEECSRAIDMGGFYRIPSDKRDLNYDSYLSKGTSRNGVTEFNSNNARQLNIEETVKKLLEIPEIREELDQYRASRL